MVLFQFFRVQLQRERPTVSATVRRATDAQTFDIGNDVRAPSIAETSNPAMAPVVIVKKSR